VGELRPHPGGFEADAFTDGRWFVKLWRQQPDSDAALALTAELAARGIPVPAAERALDGSYTSAHDGRRYALFPFVDGRQGTWEDADAIARAMRVVHEIADLVLPRTDMDEWCIEVLRDRHDHPWIVDRRGEVMANVDRLEAVIERARAIEVPHVVCHHDLFPHNVLVDRDGRVTSLLDWGHTMLAPREHDVFAALCGPDPVRFCAPTARSDSTPPTSSTPGSPAHCATLQFASTTRSTWRASTPGASTGCAAWTPTSCSPDHFAIAEVARVARLHQRDLDGEAAGHRRLQMRGVCAEVLDLAAVLLGDHADHHVVVGACGVVTADAAPQPRRHRAAPLSLV
jgi:hypothetical protein